MSVPPGWRPGRPPAIVLGAGVNAIEVVRALGLVGVTSSVVAPRHDPATYSHHARALTAWDWADQASERREDELCATLLAFARAYDEPLPVFFTSDEALLFVSRHRSALDDAFRFAIADPAGVEAMADKAAFAVLASSLDLPVPATAVAHARPGTEAPRAPAPYPLVVKPLRRTPSWHAAIGSPAKAVQVQDRAHLDRLWQEVQVLDEPVLVQQLVPGPETRVESYHVYVDGAGVIAAEFTGQKVRTRPASCGHTTALTITSTDDVRDAGRAATEALDLRGVAKFDFKRSDDGRLYLLEVNPRYHLWHHPGARAGVNIPAIVYADLTGAPRPPARPVGVGTRWVHPQDLGVARADGLTAAEWLRWASSCRAKAFFTVGDPLPLVAAVYGSLSGHVRLAPSMG